MRKQTGKNGKTEYVFDYKDIANSINTTTQNVYSSKNYGYFDPMDLKSLAGFIFKEDRKDLLQTLKFWKEKCKKLEEEKA